MDTWVWIVIAAVALLVLVALVSWAVGANKRTGKLQNAFGGEYDRALGTNGDRRKAEAELEARSKRVQALEIRPLPDSERARFSEEWTRAQAQFVDEPAEAVAEADKLITEVMRVRGYPVADFEQRAADVSVDHPAVVSNYRGAREIALANARGEATTDDLREAMQQYRALFNDLLEAGEEAPREASPAPTS